MVQPKHDPDRVLSLRVTSELKERLAALLDLVPTGAAKLSRHGLAVWCLERGLIEAEAAPAAVLASPARPATTAPPASSGRARLAAALDVARALPAKLAAEDAHVAELRAARAPAPLTPSSQPPAGELPDVSAERARARVGAAREGGVSMAEIARRAGMQSSGLSRFVSGEFSTLKGDGLARLNTALTELGVP